MSYKYWDSFVCDWQKKIKSIGEWSDPDLIPLYNDPSFKTRSSLYIPEPWWGNDGSLPLHSVIINYSPGEGQETQLHSSLPHISSYANDIVLSGILPRTNCWHCKNRALPILSSLKRLNCIKGPLSLNNHLSVELIPWHMKGVNKSFWDYVSQNASVVFENVICFAANESSRIANEKLKDKVLLKINEDGILRLLDVFQTVDIGSEIVLHKRPTLSGKAFFLKFRFDSLPNNCFIALWGTRARNNLPQPIDLDEILQFI